MSRVVIRPLHKDDEGEWRRLWTAYLAFYETVLPEDVFASTFARLTGAAAEGEYRGLLATLDGRPVGLAHYLFHRSCWTVDNICYLQDLFADPDVRGAYPAINQAFVEHEWSEMTYINREEDMGHPGLREAKMALHPEFMVKKYNVIIG